jgi:hypothetical protein
LRKAIGEYKMALSPQKVTRLRFLNLSCAERGRWPRLRIGRDNQTLNDDYETSPYEEDDYEPLWDFEGQCLACDAWGRVDDLGLCDDCAAKLDRDLIRQREWDYSATAFGVSPDDREKLRQQVIAQFGAALELIAAPEEQPPRRQRKSRKTKRPKRRGV